MIVKEITRAEHEYMNIHPPIIALVTTLNIKIINAACYHINPVSSKLDWNGNLALSTGYEVQSPSIVIVGAVDTIFLEMYRDLMFLF